MAEDQNLIQELVTAGFITDCNMDGAIYFKKTTKDGEPAYDFRQGCKYIKSDGEELNIACEHSEIIKSSALPAQLVTALEFVADKIEERKRASVGLPAE